MIHYIACVGISSYKFTGKVPVRIQLLSGQLTHTFFAATHLLE